MLYFLEFFSNFQYSLHFYVFIHFYIILVQNKSLSVFNLESVIYINVQFQSVLYWYLVFGWWVFVVHIFIEYFSLMPFCNLGDDSCYNFLCKCHLIYVQTILIVLNCCYFDLVFCLGVFVMCDYILITFPLIFHF